MGIRGGGGVRPQSGLGGGTRGGGRMSTKAPMDAFARASAAAISRRASLSFHLRAHAMCAVEGRGDNARWVECELSCENISAPPLPPTPSPTQQSTATKPCRARCVEPILLSLNGAHRTQCEQLARRCMGHYPPLRSVDPALSQ